MQLNMLEAMNIYVNVVEQGSFIRAAEVLELHRPAVTRAVQNLEHDLGVKLLHRTTRQVSMTDEGEEFYQRCLSLLSELDDVRRLFSSTQPPKGRLRLDVPITLARAVIIPALGDFQNRYPDIEIVLGTSDRKIDLIAERVDCVIRFGELNDSSFVARRLGTAAMVTCAAPSYLAKHGTPHSIDELMKSHRAVNFFSNHSLQIMEWKFTVDGSIESIKIPSSILVDNSEAFLSCGLAELGVLHGLRPSLAPFIASGELTEILTDFPPPPKPVSLLYPDRRYLAPKVRVFIDWLCEVFGPDAHL
ncbi:LysR family transcriptional regulator [Salmonella enterica subsp. enterica serovar Infantis]|nr:LysR family transcriptional regulator [Salmonella enterica subsp. enterica serovar Infantis]EKG6027525.1 LysR family transcriptional regulator [Salmonella enterica subsp. enterica serovar Infantis]EKS1933307.1 LysR family transcriptional regulator [Salmonella enterica subsp. enterica serovar Infantis]EMC5551003.1 LysR family transcriptional regulator [Salmonella enterica]